jgi:hypothetical protein
LRRLRTAASVRRVDRKIDERPGLVQLLPAAAAIGADEQPIVRGVVPVDALARESENVKAGLAEQRDRLPALARVGRLDQAEQRGQVLLARLVDVGKP